MEDKKMLGSRGEDMACSFLKDKGCKILKRNERNRLGEMDIIARERKGTLVFVEVKTMREGDLTPEDQVSRKKINNMRKSAELFAGEHERLIIEKAGWRIDLIAITLKRDGSSLVRHYEQVV